MVEITQSAELSLPYPIAASHRRMRLVDDEDAAVKHGAYGDELESFTKFLAIIALQDLRTHSKVPAFLDEFLRSMLHPMLGQWNEIIRTISSEDTASCTVAQAVKGLYKSKPGPEPKQAAEKLGALLVSGIAIRTYKDVFDLLVLYRNKAWKGHGAQLSALEYKERLPLLRTIIEDLLAAAAFLSTYQLAYVDEVQVLPTGEFKHKLKRCMGRRSNPSS
jgi:hypothetical protein